MSLRNVGLHNIYIPEDGILLRWECSVDEDLEGDGLGLLKYTVMVFA
jgi:hypothetical protein